MASSKEYLNFVLEQLSGLPDISCRAMMGEYVICYQGKVIGGVCDDRFLVKPTDSAKRLMPDGIFDLPYQGAKEMLLADMDNRELLNELIPAIADDLPESRKKRGRAEHSADVRTQTQRKGNSARDAVRRAGICTDGLASSGAPRSSAEPESRL